MKRFLRALALGIFCWLLIGGEASAQQTGTQQLTLNVQAAALTISTATLPYGIATVAYSQTVVVTGGVAPYTFGISAGTLPTGLTVNAATGAITGTPTTVGTNSFTVKVVDSQGTPATATQAFGVPIVGKLVITTTSLPTAIVSQAYTGVVSFTGGSGPYTCTVSTGTLPSWATLTVVGNTCTITGTPTAPLSDTFTIQVGSAQ
jgi:hypothetical protein